MWIPYSWLDILEAFPQLNKKQKKKSKERVEMRSRGKKTVEEEIEDGCKEPSYKLMISKNYITLFWAMNIFSDVNLFYIIKVYKKDKHFKHVNYNKFSFLG